jgi:hypothetical protein
MSSGDDEDLTTSSAVTESLLLGLGAEVVAV